MRGRDDHATDDRFPQDRAVLGVERTQAAIEVAEKHEVTGGGERGAARALRKKWT